MSYLWMCRGMEGCQAHAREQGENRKMAGHWLKVTKQGTSAQAIQCEASHFGCWAWNNWQITGQCSYLAFATELIHLILAW